MDCQVDQPISDIIVHEWTKFENQTKDNVEMPRYWEASFLSANHLIMIPQFNQVSTFHLKEHYWSQLEIQMTEDRKYLTNMSYLVRPGLIVDFQLKDRRDPGPNVSLVLLTWDTDQGILKNFCQRVQELNFPIPDGKQIYSSSVYSDGTYLYVLGGLYGEDYGSEASFVYQINLEIYEVLERKIEGKKPCQKYNKFHSSGDENRERIFYDGKLFALAKEEGDMGQIGLWIFHFDELKWQKLQDTIPGKFESYVLEGRCYVTKVDDEILIYSIKDQEKHLAILSYDLKKNSWTDGFLVKNTPKIATFGLEPLLVYKNSLIAVNVIENTDENARGGLFGRQKTKISLSVVSLKVPSEHEKSTREQIKAHMEKLCEGKTNPDVVFKVEDQEFPANKFILSYRSSYFKNAFSSNMVESRSDIITIDNVRPKVFKVLLQYIYLEEFEIEDDILEDLFKLANEYNMKKLSTDCQKKLIKKITVENAISNVLFAEKYGAEKLRKACLFFIIKNCEQVFKTPNFKDLNGDVCYEIVKLSNYYTTRDSKKDEVELLMI